MIPVDQVASLALFARVVHHRSFSAAAREAGMAKSAVSRRVAELEAALRVRLLHRTTRSLSLTEEGERVHAHARALVAAADAAQEVAGLATGAVLGTLRLNATAAFSQLYLARAVSAFLALHPEVEVHLSTDDRMVDVVEGGFDVVFRIGRLVDSSLVSRRLATDRLVVCASPEYLARAGTPRATRGPPPARLPPLCAGAALGRVALSPGDADARRLHPGTVLQHRWPHPP